MKLNTSHCALLCRKLLKKHLSVRLIMLIAFITVSANSHAQNITLDVTGAKLKTVLKEIKKQSGYSFVVDEQLLDKAHSVTLHLKNADINETLERLFQTQQLNYAIENKVITIKEKPHPQKVTDKPQLHAGYGYLGIVMDTSQKPIPGATVKLLPGKFITATDNNGTFQFSDVGPGSYVLTISSIGFLPLTMNIDVNANTKQTFTSFELKDATLALNEVAISTGYQYIKPEQSTGAVSRIGTKEYESQISTDFLTGLVDKLPGLVINPNVSLTSSAGGITSQQHSLFNIRGISTISGDQTPLIVLDGYPTTLSLDMIDPNEIKSVTVLKDAAASAIYGVQASNGVIIIERKQAQQGQAQIAFRATAGFTPSENYSRYRWASNASAIDVAYQKAINQNSVNSATMNLISNNNLFGVPYSQPYYILAEQAAGAITRSQAGQQLAALSMYNNAKDYDKLFLQTAATQTYNLDVSGGNTNALYYITGNYTGNRLEQDNNNNNRILLSGRTTIQFNKRFSLELTTDYQEEHAKAAPVPDINSIYPYEHFQDPQGNPAAIQTGSAANPFRNAYLMALGLPDDQYYPLTDMYSVTDQTHTVNDRITAHFNYRIGAGFDLSFGGDYETSRIDGRHYAPQSSSQASELIDYYATQASDGSLMYNIPPGGFLVQNETNDRSYTVRAQLNYNKRFGKDHSINAILGSEVRDETSQSSNTVYFGYNDQTLLQQPVNLYDLFGPVFTSTVGGVPNYSIGAGSFSQAYTDNRFVSGYSNLVYSFRDTYSLTASGRIDQSNLFGTNPKYRYKPLWSLGAAWNIDKEKFIQDLIWVKSLKLRIADGFDGNVAKLSLPQVIASAYTNTYTNPSSPALQQVSPANSSLRWEETNNFNIGLDWSIFKNITGSIDYYNKRSTDLLASNQVDPTLDLRSTYINSASIDNRGLEVSLHADWISKKSFNWNTGFVLSRNTSKVLKVYQPQSFGVSTINSYGYVQGYPVGALFDYRDAGLSNTGDPQIKDSKGNVYNAATDINAPLSDVSTLRYMGSTIPTINAGISNRVDVGNFYFYAMVNYSGGFKVQVPRPDPSAVRPLDGAQNYWQKPGDEKNTSVMSLSDFYTSNTGSAPIVYNNLDTYAVNGDYITLSALTASYSFNQSLFFKKLGFNNFEIKLQASNIYTIGFNKYDYSLATGSYAKSYITPTYTVGLFTNF